MVCESLHEACIAVFTPVLATCIRVDTIGKAANSGLDQNRLCHFLLYLHIISLEGILRYLIFSVRYIMPYVNP